jgi:MFS family permease
MSIAAVNSLFIPTLNSLPALAVLWVIEAVCFTASDPAGQAMITDLTEPSMRGRVYGVMAMAGGLGAVIGPLAGGWLYDAYSQSAPFVVNAAALAASAAGILLALREPRRAVLPAAADSAQPRG